MCKNGDSLRGSGKAFNLQKKNRRTNSNGVSSKALLKGILIGDGYAVKGNVEEVKGDKKVLKLDGDELRGDREVLKGDEKVSQSRYLAKV